MTDSGQTRRVVLLAISPRVPPGLLSFDAWVLLTSGAAVCHGDDTLAVLPWLAQAEVETTLLPGPARAQVETLLGAASVDLPVVWLLADDGDSELTHALAEAAVISGADFEVETMPAAWDQPGARLLDVVSVMDRLRGPGGCPWDAEQTHASLGKYLIEEAYEALDTIQREDHDHLRDELGDVLLQVAFHSRIAAERSPEDGGFTIDDVAGGLVDKLVRRHPHVFAGLAVDGAAEVQANWDDIKRAEKPAGFQPLDDLPASLPALTLARTALSKASKAGVRPPLLPDVEVPATAQGVGLLLWRVVEQAAAVGVDAEEALRAAVLDYRESLALSKGE